MGLGRARPLCCFCWMLVLSSAVCLRFDHWRLSLALTAVALLVLVIASVLAWRAKDRSVRRARGWYVAFLAFAVLLGSGLVSARQGMDARRNQVYAETEPIMQAVVLSAEHYGSFSTAYTVRLESLDEQSFSGKAYLQCAFTSALQPGDRVSAQAVLRPLQEMQTAQQYLADGCRWYIELADETQIRSVSSTGSWEHPLLYIRLLATRLQRSLSLRLQQSMDRNAGALCAALLLGDRTSLDGQITLHFRRSGVSHLLALSGMHLSLIMAVVSWLLTRLRLPYRLRLPTLCVVALGYLLLTGCSISTMRAAAMLLLLQCAKLFGREADGLTSLSLFFAVCVACEPYMLYDIALWLTSLAVAVPIAILPALQELGKREVKPSSSRMLSLWRWLSQRLLTPLGISLLCTLILLLPMWLTFGEISYLSPVATFLLTLPVTLILTLGVFWLLLAPLAAWTVAAFWQGYLAAGMERVADATLELVERGSALPNMLLSLRYASLRVIMPLLAIVLVSCLLSRLRRRSMAILLSVCLILGTVSVAAEMAHTRDSLQCRYVTAGNSEILWLADGESNVLCDFTDGSYRCYARLLQEGLDAGHTEIDTMILTHYHGKHLSMLERLSAAVCIRRLYLPLSMELCPPDKAADDEGVARKLLDFAEKQEIEVTFYEPTRSYTLDESFVITGLQYAMLQRSAHPALVLCLRHDGRTVSFIGSAFAEGEPTDAFARDTLADSEIAVFGAHGPLTKAEFSLDRWSDTLQHVVVRQEVGTYFVPNRATLAALLGAQCSSVCKTEDGVTVAFCLPGESKDETRHIIRSWWKE